MKILVTGAQGMLGRDIVETAKASGYSVIETDRDTLDITDEQAVRSFVEQEQPKLIINTAAYNFVDKVEDPAVYPLALAVNATGPGNLAKAAKDVGAALVHYSTDYVFAGEKPDGYAETDATNPISKYGETKAAGEEAVLHSGAQAYVCRLSKIFGRPGLSEGSKESFVALMLHLAKEKPELSIVDEEVGCPTYTKDAALATKAMLESLRPPGVYHMINGGEGVTWYGFAKEFFQIAGVTTPYKAVAADAFPPRPALRPKFTPLLNTKLPPLRPRVEALKDFLSSSKTSANGVLLI